MSSDFTILFNYLSSNLVCLFSVVLFSSWWAFIDEGLLKYPFHQPLCLCLSINASYLFLTYTLFSSIFSLLIHISFSLSFLVHLPLSVPPNICFLPPSLSPLYLPLLSLSLSPLLSLSFSLSLSPSLPPLPLSSLPPSLSLPLSLSLFLYLSLHAFNLAHSLKMWFLSRVSQCKHWP